MHIAEVMVAAGTYGNVRGNLRRRGQNFHVASVSALEHVQQAKVLPGETMRHKQD